MTLAASTPKISTQIFADPDEYQSFVRGGSSLYTVLRGGVFQAELTSVHLGGLLIQRGREQLPRVAATGIAPGRAAIVTWLRGYRLPIVRGVQIERGDILYLGGGAESHHRTTGPNEYVAVTFDANLLKRAALDATGREPTIASGLTLRPPDYLRGLLPSVLEAALGVAAGSPQVFESPLSVASLEQSILQALVLCIEHSETLNERSQRRHRALLAKRFEAAVEANLDQELEIPDLCRVVGASGRALRSLCQEQLGISPQRFVAIRRMRRIRLALTAAEHPSRTVTDIAMQFGIWELGRFAASYKALFGEAPSVTLRRPP